MKTFRLTYMQLGFVCLLLLEFFLFQTFVLREITNYYPGHFDQSRYLSTLYSVYDNILKGNFTWTCVKQTFMPTSITFLLQSVVFLLFFGASRLSALLIGFFYFVLLQVIVVKTIHTFTRNHFISLIFLGLLLSMNAPFLSSGGIVDFRIDFITLCLYGIFVSCVIQTNLYLEKKWTIFSALTASWLILTRPFVAGYILPILLILIGYWCWKYYFRKNSFALIRLKNAALFSGIVIIIITPFLWIMRHTLYDYYIVTHFMAEKNIRIAEWGTPDFYSGLTFYINSILFNHLGYLTLFLLALIFIYSALMIFREIGGMYTRVREDSSTEAANKLSTEVEFRKKSIVIFLLLAITIPFIILNLDTQKSPVVMGILVVPILWLAILPLIWFSPRNNHWTFKIFALLIFMIGASNWVSHFSKHGEFYGRENNLKITKMFEDIGEYTQKTQWQNFTYSTDQIVDYLTIGNLNTLVYEKKGILLTDTPTLLGLSIFSISPETALQTLEQSDIFIENLHPYSASPYLFNQDMQNIRPLLKSTLKKKFIVLGDYHFKGSIYRVYVKPHNR